jgi:hypothetical protein
MSFFLLLVSSLQQNFRRAEQVLPRSEVWGGEGRGGRAGRKMAQTMYPHVNK